MRIKKKARKPQRVVKGMPSAVLLSIVVHAALFLLAGMLVVFTVVKKEEKKFEPPKAVDRPKMKLKKPKVKIKKTSKPKPTTRIVTKMNRASMPDIQLPEMSGMGEGLGGGIGGFDMMPDLGEVTVFGSGQSIGNDLEGVIYDFKRRRNGKKFSVSMAPDDRDSFRGYVEKYIRSGWKASSIARFYRSPKKLYTPAIMVPPTESAFGPWAFGEPEMYPYQYMIHYKGQLVHPDGIKFRFVVMGDNFLLIRVNNQVVLDYKNQFAHAWDGKESKPLSYHLGHWWAYAGEWIELEPGVPQEMEVILGEYSGGLFAAMVAVEVYGEEYPSAPSPQDNPVLPIFKTSVLTADQVDNVHEYMWEGHLDYASGPVFCDYDPAGKTADAPVPGSTVEPGDAETLPVDSESALRTWTLNAGKTVEAEYVNLFGGKVVLKGARGKVAKVPLTEFSPEDLYLIELLNPPELRMDFKKHTSNFKVLSNPTSTMPIPFAQTFAGGVVVRQQNMKNYPHPLRLEMYVILAEYDGDNFILFDRQVDTFRLTPENERRFEVVGNKSILRRYEYYGGAVRGEKYKGYMILVYDERGEIVAQNLSHDWLFDIRDKLLVFPVGRHFNKQGERVFPPSPPFSDHFWSMGTHDW